MGYQPFCTHHAATSYKPRKLCRPLRQGAQVTSNLKHKLPLLKSLPSLHFCNYLINSFPTLYNKRLATLWKPLSVFFKDELVQVVPSPEGQLNLVSHRMDFDKPTPEEVAERNVSLLNLVPPQALVYPTESNPLRIFVSRSQLEQRT